MSMSHSAIPNKVPTNVQPSSAETKEAVRAAELFVQTLLSSEEEPKRKPKFFKAHLAELDTVRTEERDFEWLKARTLLCAFYRKHPLFVRRFNTKLAHFIRESQGEAASQAFKTNIQRAMFPYRLSGHGYRTPFSERNNVEVAESLKSLMDQVQRVTSSELFINSGTLLGAHRGKGFIPHDDDIDLAIHLGDEGEENAVRRLIDVVKALSGADLLAANSKSKLDMALIKIKPIDGIEIDIFPAWSAAGRYSVWPHTYGDISLSEVMPLGTAELHGVSVAAPANPDAMIAQNYGPNWRDPDDDFRFQWKRARTRFESFFKLWSNSSH